MTNSVGKHISHRQWCEITLEHFVKAGMTEEHLFEVADSTVLVSDAIETLRYYWEAGVKLYIVSGSIHSII